MTEATPPPHWSTGWYSLLVQGGTQRKTTPATNDTVDWTAQKEDAIRECLEGNASSQAVNLWHLRTLCLQRGGLLSPEWRKRAWPKLVAAAVAQQQQQAASTTATATPRQPLTRSMVQALQTDLRTAVWDVEGELRRRKQARQLEQAQIDARLEQERLRNRRVKFAPVQQQAAKDKNDDDAPGIIRSASTHSEEDEDDDYEQDNASISSRLSIGGGSTMGASPCGTVASYETNMVSLLSNSSVHSSSRSVRGRKATINEQRILYKLITSLLQTSPPPLPITTWSSNDNHKPPQQRYTYHPGFQDMVALFLYNLESPTMTSMVLPQLATHHWRVLLSSKSQLEGFLLATFMPLLAHVDARLAQHLQTQGMRLPTFGRSWMATWFASDTGEADAASRLLDVLLVSHPWMVVYLSVAWVTQYRERLLAISDFCVLAKLLRRLPMEGTSTTTADDEWSVVEDVIAQALRYMEVCPPLQLQKLAHNLSSSPSSMHLNAQSIPAWLTADVAPNDWAVLAKQFNVAAVDKVDPQAYPLALLATGQTAKTRGMSRGAVVMGWKCLLLLMAAVMVMATGAWLHPTAWPSWHNDDKVVPLQYLSAKRLIPLLSSRKALVPVALLDDHGADMPSSSKAIVLFSSGSGHGAATQFGRVPWWTRFRRVVERLIHHVWFWENWFTK